MRNGLRIPAWLGLVACVALFLTFPTTPVQAQSLNLLACKKVIPRGAVEGSELIMRDCGSRFTAQDPYVAVIVHLQRVEYEIRLGIQLLDPQENTVWAGRGSIRPDPGISYSDIWIWALIPLAADPAALALENRLLVSHMLQFRGKPWRERTGEWTMRAIIDSRPPRELKFTLEGVPMAAPSPAPTPAAGSGPAPTPEPSPTSSP
jgi:hypothetical protein